MPVFEPAPAGNPAGIDAVRDRKLLLAGLRVVFNAFRTTRLNAEANSTAPAALNGQIVVPDLNSVGRFVGSCDNRKDVMTGDSRATAASDPDLSIVGRIYANGKCVIHRRARCQALATTSNAARHAVIDDRLIGVRLPGVALKDGGVHHCGGLQFCTGTRDHLWHGLEHHADRRENALSVATSES